MKNILLAVAVLSFMMAGPTWALDFNVGPYYDGPEDVTQFVKDIGHSQTSRMATGVCNGVFAKVENDGKWIADVLSPCAFGAASYQAEDQADASALFGVQIINFMGIRFGVYRQVAGADGSAGWVYGGGISLTGAAGQLLK